MTKLLGEHMGDSIGYYTHVVFSEDGKSYLDFLLAYPMELSVDLREQLGDNITDELYIRLKDIDNDKAIG